jgi:cobyrinic acid a,c-diamide synthase
MKNRIKRSLKTNRTMTSIPRILIAGTHSGCGKTTIASGIMAALTARGLKVQPFKVGPDFIDPSHHTRICGRPSRNLDPFMMNEEGCLETFVQASRGADIAVIEGVMGMFDGVDGSDLSSSAHVARILQSPVILVADVKGMSRSIHALTRGFLGFDPSVRLAGVIYNRIGSPRHKDMIASSGTIPSYGWIPRRDEIGLSSRHLGLVMAHETESLKHAGEVIEEFADLDAIISTAQSVSALTYEFTDTPETPERVKIGVAHDPAFCFYYQDNLDHLRNDGAKLVFFSPLVDNLPRVDALYFGGGYPELHLPALESSPCTKALKSAVDNDLPVYAECGGLMYLSREIQAERTFRMARVLPGDAEMTKKIQALGYTKGEVTTGSSLLPKGQIITGHEFHYSRLIPDRDVRYAINLSRGKGIHAQKDGLFAGNAIGMYTHAYFSRNLAASLIKAAGHYSQQ